MSQRILVVDDEQSIRTIVEFALKDAGFDVVSVGRGDDALAAVAKMACERKVGARGLRMILEELMLDAMYTLPSQKKIKEFVVTREMVETKRAAVPLLEKAG